MTVPLGIPAPKVAETCGFEVTVAVVLTVEMIVVVRIVEVTMVCGGLSMTSELVPPMKLNMVEADS